MTDREARPISLGRKASFAHPLRLAVMVSGRGSNMQALALAAKNQEVPAVIAQVFSDRPDAPALEKAKAFGLPHCSRDFRQATDRDRYYRDVASMFVDLGVECVALAGYMRILPGFFVERFRHQILNVHPSLLPAFPGLHPHRQALEHGVKVSGCTVHLVEDAVDAGPIVLQKAVNVEPSDTPESLAERILEQEHAIYPQAVAMMASGRLRLEGRRVWMADGEERGSREH